MELETCDLGKRGTERIDAGLGIDPLRLVVVYARHLLGTEFTFTFVFGLLQPVTTHVSVSTACSVYCVGNYA